MFYLDDVLDGYVIVEDVMVVVDDAVNENDLIVFCYVVGPLNATPVHITHNLFLVKDCYGCLSGVSIVASVTFFYLTWIQKSSDRLLLINYNPIKRFNYERLYI